MKGLMGKSSTQRDTQSSLCYLGRSFTTRKNEFGGGWTTDGWVETRQGVVGVTYWTSDSLSGARLRLHFVKHQARFFREIRRELSQRGWIVEARRFAREVVARA